MKCYINLVICILYPFFIWSYSSHRITMQCFTCIYIDINIKYVSIGHIIHFLCSKYGPKTMKILCFLPIQYSIKSINTHCVYTIILYTCYQNRQAYRYRQDMYLYKYHIQFPHILYLNMVYLKVAILRYVMGETVLTWEQQHQPPTRNKFIVVTNFG